MKHGEATFALIYLYRSRSSKFQSLLLLSWLCVVFSGAAQAGAAQAGTGEPDAGALLAQLGDQDKKGFERREGSRLVFVVGDKTVPTQTERWADELESALPVTCQVVRLLDLQEVPRAGGPLVRRKIRKQIGDQPKRVFLDWDGLIARHFDIRIDIPVIVCLDRNDDVIEIIEGAYSKKLRDRVRDLYP